MARIRPANLVTAQLEEANIPIDYWDCQFLNFSGPVEAREASKQYLKKLDEMLEEGIGILYAGGNGIGKSTLAMIIMKYLIRAGWDVYATSLGEMVETIQTSWKDIDNEELEAYRKRCRESTFLLIDDIGKEHRGKTGFVQTVFDNLIRYRVQHRLPTFLTTNLTKEELRGTYGESALSLLEGRLATIVVSGEDFRRTKLKNDIRNKFLKENNV